jgi:RNA polymerase sigma-70 factor (ECF subfamily)
MERLTPELKRRLLDGDEQAYEALLERFEKPVIRFIDRMIGDRAAAEDLFQETFIRILRALPNYEPRGRFSTWVFAIARNLCLDHLKYKRRHPAGSLDAGRSQDGGKVIYFRDLLEAADVAPLDQVDRRESVEMIRVALTRLNDDKREALVLRIFHDLPYAEIAEITGVPVGTAKYRVHEGVRALGELVKTIEQENSSEESGYGM